MIALLLGIGVIGGMMLILFGFFWLTQRFWTPMLYIFSIVTFGILCHMLGMVILQAEWSPSDLELYLICGSIGVTILTLLATP